VKHERVITQLPRLPAAARWVLPRRRKLHWARYLHVAHRGVDLTLCGRVRPGEEVLSLEPDVPFCPRCLYRASALWTWV
jgi:hypothetical protein